MLFKTGDIVHYLHNLYPHTARILRIRYNENCWGESYMRISILRLTYTHQIPPPERLTPLRFTVSSSCLKMVTPRPQKANMNFKAKNGKKMTTKIIRCQ